MSQNEFTQFRISVETFLPRQDNSVRHLKIKLGYVWKERP